MFSAPFPPSHSTTTSLRLQIRDSALTLKNNNNCISRVLYSIQVPATSIYKILLIRALRRPLRADATDNLLASPPSTICWRRRRRQFVGAAAADNLLALPIGSPPPINCGYVADSIFAYFL